MLHRRKWELSTTILSKLCGSRSAFAEIKNSWWITTNWWSTMSCRNSLIRSGVRSDAPTIYGGIACAVETTSPHGQLAALIAAIGSRQIFVLRGLQDSEHNLTQPRAEFSYASSVLQVLTKFPIHVQCTCTSHNMVFGNGRCFLTPNWMYSRI